MRRGVAGCVITLLAILSSLLPATPAAAATPAPIPLRGLTAPALIAYLPWYDLASPGMRADNVHVANPGTAPASGTISLPGAATLPFSVPPGGEGWYSFPPGTIGGPVAVAVSSGPAVLASQRTLYQDSLSETGALSAADAFMTGWFNWYDNTSAGMGADYVHLVNPGAGPASGTVSVGSLSLPFTLTAGGEQHLRFPDGTIGGPVRVQVTSGAGILATQRSSYSGSLAESPALSSTAAATSLWLPWYDLQSDGMTADMVHVLDPGASPATVTVTLGSATRTLTLPAGGEGYTSLAGSMGGPLAITSTVPVLASQRIVYHGDLQEQNALGASDAAQNWEFNWYDNGSPGFLAHVHVVNPGAAAATVNLLMPARNPVTLTVGAGQDAWYAYPAGTVSGPLQVQVASGPAVLASLRQFVYVPPPPPPPPKPAGHRIVVSLAQQHLWAYDGDTLFLETDITSGRPELPTPPGLYAIFAKHTPYQFISPWPYGSPYWYASAWVSYAMEFIEGGYFLHDAPWRDWFGPGSNYGDGTHGCVNVPIDPMTALYQWAQIGDKVVVVSG